MSKDIGFAEQTLWILGFFSFGIFMGWISAHKTVATECTRLGKFYVGETVYECKITNPSPKP